MSKRTSRNSTQFEANLEAQAAVIVDNNEKRIKNILRKLVRDVVNDTPVDTGVLKNNWYANTGSPPRRKNSRPDPSGQGSIQRANKTIDRMDLNKTFYLGNNLPYAGVVEFGLYPNPPKNPTGKTVNGFSKQAPSGMLRINVQKAINRIRAGK